MLQEVYGSFVPTDAYRQQLIDAGWTPPRNFGPRRTEVVVYLHRYAGAGTALEIGKPGQGSPRNDGSLAASVRVELIDGVFAGDDCGR